MNFYNSTQLTVQIILNSMNSTDCPKYDTKGCGLNSFCGKDEYGLVTTCVDDNSEVGYRCAGRWQN